MSLFDDEEESLPEVLPCKCRVYARNNIYSHTSKECWGNKLTGRVDILILLEFKEVSEKMEKLFSFFDKYLSWYTWRMIPAVGCTPKGFEFKNSSAQPYIDCKRHNTDQLIKDANPKVILTVGRGLYTILNSGDLLPQHFYSLHDDDTWLYSPEYNCKVLPLPAAFLWLDWDVYERHFVKEQIKRAVRFVQERSFRIPRFKLDFEHNPDLLLKRLIEDTSIEWIAVDTETSGLNYFVDELYSIQFSWTGYHGVFILFSEIKDKQLLRDLFSKKKIIMHNASFDLKFLWRNGIENAKCDFDTMLASHAINENSPNGLKILTWIYTYYGGYEDKLQRYLDLYKISDFRLLPEDILVEYGAIDPCITYQLKVYFEKRLNEEDERVRWNFYDIVMPAVPVIAEMEMNGIPVDVEYMYKFNDILNKRKRRIEFILQRLAGPGENTKSGKVLSRIVSSDPNFELLHDDKGNPLLAKNGDLLLNKDTVPLYAKQGVKAAKYLIKYRQVIRTMSMLGIEKLKQKDQSNTDSLFEIEEDEELQAEDGFMASIIMIDDRYGTLHTNFNLAGTDTGRLSSKGGLTPKSKINGQNFTKRKEERLIFGAPKGWVLAQYDYNAMEMRIASQVSGPGTLEKLLLENKDLHCYTLSKALELQGKPESYEDLVRKSKELEDPYYVKLREKAKPVNFGAIYNIQPYTLAESLDIPVEEAQQFLDAFFEGYSEYKHYMERQNEFVRKNGWVISLMGKKRRIPQLTYVGRDTDNAIYRKKTGYNNLINIAYNQPIQSTSGLTTIKAMTEIYKDWKSKGMQSKIVGNVHDAIWFLFKVEEIQYCHESVERLMCQPYYENVGGNKVLHKAEGELGPYGFGKKIKSSEQLEELVKILGCV